MRGTALLAGLLLATGLLACAPAASADAPEACDDLRANGIDCTVATPLCTVRFAHHSAPGGHDFGPQLEIDC